MELKEIKLSPKKIELLNALEIDSVEELLTHYPFRYEELILKHYDEWAIDEKIVCEGEIIKPVRILRFGKNRSMSKFTILFEEEEIECTIFNRPWASAFPFGKRITVMGTYQGNNKLVLTNYNLQPLSEQLGVHPIYSTREGISQKDWVKMIDKAMNAVLNQVEDLIPNSYQSKYQLLHRQQALYLIHKPRTMNDVKLAIRTLKYEEFLLFQCCMQTMKNENAHSHGIAKNFDYEQIQELTNTLPFELTQGQRAAIDDILSDMQSTKNMMRLVQGDVGCGKTMVAVFALYACILAHKQGAFMVPTELLAKQHVKNLQRIYKDFDVRIELYCSSLKAMEKKAILSDLKNNKIDLLIGTHALFQEDVLFYDLGLVVADEQHRFGVSQRRRLLAKGEKVDFLLMSATPIPRTLATSMFGDLDVSTIDQLPANRATITTKYIKTISMKPILEDVLCKIDEGNQAYVVCPAIESNEEYHIKGVEEIYAGMVKTLGNKYRLALLHGKMSSEEKDQIMTNFVDHKIDILVSTTVIEVGVDVKNANIMVIYDAHRFGLAQIHQLRGRVGRGELPGYCYLLSNSSDEESIKRLKVLEKTTDGFEIATHDLVLRGPGDLLGTRQSGIPSFILGDCLLDSKILEVARNDAQEILANFEDNHYNELRKQVFIRVESTKYLD